MSAALRILWNVAIYRLRRREMANLAASTTIMFALRLGWSDVLVRVAFGLLLNLFVYLTNDLCDVEADLASKDKDEAKVRELIEHHASARFVQVGLVAAMAAIALAWRGGLVTTLLVAVPICWAYCARFKRMAFSDIAIVFCCGTAGSLLAFPLDRSLGWTLAVQLGLFAAAFQAIQVIRDYADDAAFGIRTSAVALGLPRAIALQRALLAVSAIYAILALHWLVGIALLVAPLLPFDSGRAVRHWNRIRATLGLGWLAIIAWILWTGNSAGLLLVIERSDSSVLLRYLP